MDQSSIKSLTEVFHLVFLRFLEHTVDKRLYALKGGCNLRFFHKSIRYSEDMDLDIRKMAKQTLQKNVEKIFTSQGFQQSLETKGIEVEKWSAPKQTETTQRWKLQLKFSNLEISAPTKIEFSRRYMDDGIEYSPVNSDLIRQYGLYQLLASHYSLHVAAYQKILALLGRSATQSRDIFDIAFLLDSGATLNTLPEEMKDKWKDVEERILSIDFATYTGQVVAFLMPEYQEFYAQQENWDKLVGDLLEKLQIYF